MDQGELMADKTPFEKIFGEIAEERGAQDVLWGNEHDDQHDPEDWVGFIIKHAKKSDPSFHLDKEIFRKQMVRVAALAVAAIEWVDRR